MSNVELLRLVFLSSPSDNLVINRRGSRAKLSGCNVVRNGFGSRRQAAARDGGLPGDGGIREQFEAVPSGHSGE